MQRNIKAEIIGCLAAFLLPTAAGGQQSINLGMHGALAEQRQSLFAQRDSLKRQMGNADFTALLSSTFYGTIHPTPNTQVTFRCPALDVREREDIIQAAAKSQAIEPALVRAVMHRESEFHPCAVSSKGALGLMQLMPATIAQFGVRDPFDPAQSVHAGAALLRNLLDRYQGDVKLTLAAYNAGPGRIDRANPDTYPAETKTYVAQILNELAETTRP
jgi:hypothetical protein